MAARNLTVDSTTVGPDDVLIILAQDGATEDSPTSITNIAVELNTSNPEIVLLLEKLENLGLAQYESLAGQFMAWLADPEITPETAQDAYNKAAGIKAPKSVRKAAQPIKGSDGKNVTVPVSEGSSERRELDAAQGERVISEDNMRDVVRNLTKGENVDMDNIPTGSWENEAPETHYVLYDADNVTGHMILPEPENIPEPPKGVNPNFWELAYTANTLPARKYWYAKCIEQIKAYKEEEVKTEETPKPEPKPRPIDPETGLEFPF